jgi:hypothetical protein
MRRWIARALQLIGLLVLPIGIAGNIHDPTRVTEGVMLGLTAVGGLIFYVGWSIQGRA